MKIRVFSWSLIAASLLYVNSKQIRELKRHVEPGSLYRYWDTLRLDVQNWWHKNRSSELRTRAHWNVLYADSDGSRCIGPPLWSSCQSFWLQIQRFRVRSPALPDFLSSSEPRTGSTQPREVKLRSYLNKKSSDPRFRKQRLTAVGTRCANHVTPLYPQKLALTSPTALSVWFARGLKPRSLV